MNIVTERVSRRFRGYEEWTAVDDDTYDGPDSPIGVGHTAEEAEADLLEQLEDDDASV